jgi:hypothetical protein
MKIYMAEKVHFGYHKNACYVEINLCYSWKNMAGNFSKPFAALKPHLPVGFSCKIWTRAESING